MKTDRNYTDMVPPNFDTHAATLMGWTTKGSFLIHPELSTMRFGCRFHGDLYCILSQIVRDESIP